MSGTRAEDKPNTGDPHRGGKPNASHTLARDMRARPLGIGGGAVAGAQSVVILTDIKGE